MPTAQALKMVLRRQKVGKCLLGEARVCLPGTELLEFGCIAM
jgi:hypothetical protein